MQGPGIVLRSATFTFGSNTVLRMADFDLPRGGTAVITGRNGSGKSTLLYLAAGLVGLQSGVVTLAGHRADALHPSDMFRRGIRRGFVFQEGGLLSNMNALANVALPLRYHADVLGLSVQQIEERAIKAMRRVRINEPDFYALPAHLSFGNRKRLALARALAIEPNFFFFDDPDVGMDPRTAALVHELLCAFRDDPEVTMLVATNRELLIERLGVPGYALHDGKVVDHAVAPASSLHPGVA
jgi:ABC-type transporter Mla maintaining outer membrane lipid asymmetry ATPase subunit MlaF